MAYIARGLKMPSENIFNHLGLHLTHGCGTPYFPPLERCFPELGALLRRNSTAQAVGPYLWLYAAAYLYQHPSPLAEAVALQQIGDALAAADAESLDQQLRQLQGIPATSSLLITSRQLQWLCYHAAHGSVRRALEAALRNGTMSEAHTIDWLNVWSATQMMQLEPFNHCSLHVAATIAESGSASSFQLLQQAYEEAKRQHRYLAAYEISSAAVGVAAQSLSPGFGSALSRSAARATVAAFQEAETNYRSSVFCLSSGSAWQQQMRRVLARSCLKCSNL